MNKIASDGTPVYPVLNVYMSPRVNQQKVNTQRNPLCKYTKIISTDVNSFNDSKIPTRNNLKPFKSKDGLIYDFRNISQQRQPYIGSIKVLICVCMYNQGANAINLTLNGIYDNLQYLENQGIASQQIGVVLIQDGILKLVNDRKRRKYAQGKNSIIQFFKKLDQNNGKSKCELEQRLNIILDSIDGFQRKGMTERIKSNNDFPPNIQKNISMLYQNLWDPSKTNLINNKQKSQNQKKYDKKLRLFSCFKHTNGTKLSSHLLFFQGFCRYLKPQFCVLLDVGTKPQKKGLVNLIRGFYYGKNIGGVTGLMSIDSNFQSLEGDEQDRKDSGCCYNSLLSIEKAQQYQYIIAHFLDKNAQSALGFLHVLPGAWSAYRYSALIKSQKYQPNLLQKSYFKMILNPQLQQKDYMEANMYLAQDRILSLGIYCQMNSNYVLKYIPDAIAKTDPMKDHKNLMNQRRRWINSSLFAFLYVFNNYYYNVAQSKHNCFRKYITLNISMFIALLSFITSYFTPAIYFFILYVTIYQIDINSNFVSYIAIIVSTIYVMVVLIAVAGSLTGKIWAQKAHYISYILTGFTLIMYGLIVYNVFFIYIDISSNKLNLQDFNILTLIILSAINVVCFILIIIIHIPTHCSFVCKLILNQISYIAYMGAYSQTMVIHGFCNVDDVSWGTKGTSTHGVNKYNQDKVFFVSSWLLYNCILAYIFLYIDIVVPQRTNTNGGKVFIAIAFYATFIIVAKTILAVYNHFKWIFFQKCCVNFKIQPSRKQNVKKYMATAQQQYLKETQNSLIY